MFALLAIFTLLLVIVFLLLLRSGFLDDLPNILRGDQKRTREIEPEQIEGRIYDPEGDDRLDVFKNFLESGEEEDKEEP